MSAEMEFFVDPARCIGCQSCVHACSECETHKGHSMIAKASQFCGAMDD